MEEIEENKIAQRILAKIKSLPVLRSEAVRIAIMVFSSLAAILFFLPFCFDNSALKFQISQKISKISGANFAILGDVEIAFLPVPTISIGDVLMENYKIKSDLDSSEVTYNFYAKRAQITLPVFGDSSDMKIGKVVLEDAVFQSYEKGEVEFERNDKFKGIIDEINKNPPKNEKQSSSGVTTKIFAVSEIKDSELTLEKLPKILIKNGAAIFYDSYGKKKEIRDINTTIKLSPKRLSAVGNFDSEGIASDFKMIAKFEADSQKPESLLEIKSSALQLRILGNFTSKNNGILASDFNGKIEAEIADLKNFYQSYVGGKGVIAEKLQYNAKPIKISSEIKNETGFIALHNLVINSVLMNGKGEIGLGFSEKIPVVDIDLDLEDLDLDSILSPDSVQNVSSEIGDQDKAAIANDAAEVVPQVADLSPDNSQQGAVINESQLLQDTQNSAADLVKEIKNIDLVADIKIAKTKYLNGDVKNVSIYATVSQAGEIMISPMIAQIPGSGSLRVYGVVDNNSDFPKFVGKFDASGENLAEVFKWLKIESPNLRTENLKSFSVYSDFILVPNISRLSNFYLNLNTDSSEFLGEFTINRNEKSANILSKFRSNNFNVDDFFLTSGKNIYLSPGSMLKKLFWLNEISSSVEAEFNFDNLIYRGEKFYDQSLKLRVGRGIISISGIKLHSDKTNLDADISVDISDQNPQFILNVVAEKLHYNSRQDDDVTGDKSSKDRNFFDQFFDLPSLEGFGGKIHFSIADAELDKVSVQNLKFFGTLRDGVMNKAEFSCDAYGGNLTYNGALGIKFDKIFSGNVVFKEAHLKELLTDTVGISNVSGVANIAANISSIANKKSEFLRSFSSEIKFSVNAPSVEGYGLRDLSNKMFLPKTYSQELLDPEAILLNPESVTEFKQADGKISFNGKGKGVAKINVSGSMMNGILSGEINPAQSNTNLLFNVIFLTGNRQKQTPLNIATNIQGSFGSLEQKTNLDQVLQYLGLKQIVQTAPVAVESDQNSDQNKSQIIDAEQQNPDQAGLDQKTPTASQ